MTARDDIEAVAGGVLRSHDWFTPRGYAWPCCTCGEEFQGGEDAAFAHVATVLAEALAPKVAEVRAEALRVVRQVEIDMSVQALEAWRSADARRGLSDHDALLVHADALTRWSERFRMAFDGDYYRDEATS
jgi:hypothetical protein